MISSRISKAPRMLTMTKGAGWKTSIVARVSVMSMVSWVSRMFEGVLDEKGGHDHVFYVDPEPWRRCRGTRRRRSRGSDAEIVREILTRISKAPRMSTTPKGEGWKV